MSLLPRFSFRDKLLAAMMLTVAGVTGATLYVTQQRMQSTYDALFAKQFEAQVAASISSQEVRLGQIKDRALKLSSSIRLNAVMGDGTPLLQYQVAFNEFGDVMHEDEDTSGDEPQGRRPRPRGPVRNQLLATFIRLLDAEGNEIPQPERPQQGLARLLPGQRKPKTRIPSSMADFYHRIMGEEAVQQVGYMLSPSGDDRVIEMVFTKIIDPDYGDLNGAFILGFPLMGAAFREENPANGILSGIWLEGELYSANIPESMREHLAGRIQTQIEQSGSDSGTFKDAVDGNPQRIFYRALNPGSAFPTAYQVSLYSLQEQIADQKDLQTRIVSFGAVVLLGALALSFLLARGLSGPIHELLEGTDQIRHGNYEIQLPVRSQDEIGQLTASFNEMAEGLAQNEKYRNVLSMVADKDVAEQLMSGSVALGGEVREISVIFCDIRGFTAMTQHMPPTEVIALMNEHFTALTRVVYEHDGVVDKFVGDLIMAVFGAPKSYGNDVYNAARCALRMIEEREKINANATQKIQVGIGLASGEAVAGCMGSSDRLNYTVMGARVNLASRLCSVAGRMEVVIDETTHERLRDYVRVAKMDALSVKGFTAPVQAYKLTEIRSLKSVNEAPETGASVGTAEHP